MVNRRRRRRHNNARLVLITLALASASLAGIALGGDDDDRPGPALSVGGAKSPDSSASSTDGGSAALDAEPTTYVGDAALRGKIDLGKLVERDDGYAVELGGGKRALLTLDPRLQKRAQKVLAHAKAPMGAIVVMAPDGRILALAGRKHGPPAVDDAYELATEVWAPAASVFKIVTASALLRAGVGADDRVCFHGGIRSVLESNLRDDPRRDNQCEDLSFAVSASNNAIVGKLAHKFLDVDKFQRAARAFGFGQPSRFALECEASRIDIPDGQLDRARFAAGFWDSELSALDGALLTNTVATGGMRVVPRIVDRVVDRGGMVQPVVAQKPKRVLPKRVAETLGAMLVRTTQSGTASRTFRVPKSSPLFGVKVAGKTGSLSRVKPSYLGYSWFVAYAPADKPQVVISVLFGNPEKWWLKAHTAGRMLMEESLARRKKLASAPEAGSKPKAKAMSSTSARKSKRRRR